MEDNVEEIPCVVGGEEIYTGRVQARECVSTYIHVYFRIVMCIFHFNQPYNKSQTIAKFHWADEVNQIVYYKFSPLIVFNCCRK